MLTWKKHENIDDSPWSHTNTIKSLSSSNSASERGREEGSGWPRHQRFNGLPGRRSAYTQHHLDHVSHVWFKLDSVPLFQLYFNKLHLECKCSSLSYFSLIYNCFQTFCISLFSLMNFSLANALWNRFQCASRRKRNFLMSLVSSPIKLCVQSTKAATVWFWKQNLSPLPRPTSFDPSRHHFNSDRSQLVISSVVRADYGEYVCTATNKITESSATIVLHVFGPFCFGIFTPTQSWGIISLARFQWGCANGGHLIFLLAEAPEVFVSDEQLSVSLGKRVSVFCNVSGHPQPQLYWFNKHNGRTLVRNKHMCIIPC